MSGRGRGGGSGLRWTDKDARDYERRTGRKIDPPGAAARPDVEPPSTMLMLDLAVPPGVNDTYYNVPGKGRSLTKKAREWKLGAERAAVSAALLQRFLYRAGQRLRLSITCCFADDRRDLDGILKITQDSLAAALGFNDMVVDDVHLRRGAVDPVNPRLHVILSVAGAEPPENKGYMDVNL